MTIPAKYTRTAIVLHWLMALLIFINLVLAFITEQIPEDRIRLAIDTHKSIGITVLGLVLMRILWRVTHAPPPLPESTPRWERRAASSAHLLFYALMLALPITGWMHDSAWKAAPEVKMHWFGLFEWPRIGWIMEMEPAAKQQLHGQLGAVHEWFGFALIGLWVLHVGAALKHQFIDRHAELQRMLP